MIAAGIVTYNPDMKRLRDNIYAVIGQVSSIVIIDNASDNIGDILSLTDEVGNIQCIRNNINCGIAQALNMIFEKCMGEGYEWVLTLDQDSICPLNMIEEYKKSMDVNIAILCPKVIDLNMRNEVHEDKNNFFVKRCITSGSLTNIKAWNAINGFDEKMFIDAVDFDFCDRLGKCGYRILQINSVKMMHEIGYTQKKKFLFFHVLVRNHSAFRKYYIAKNIVYLDRKNECITYPVSTILREIKLLFIVLFYEKDKVHKIKEIMRGMSDGFTEEIQK